MILSALCSSNISTVKIVLMCNHVHVPTNVTNPIQYSNAMLSVCLISIEIDHVIWSGITLFYRGSKVKPIRFEPEPFNILNDTVILTVHDWPVFTSHLKHILQFENFDIRTSR